MNLELNKSLQVLLSSDKWNRAAAKECCCENFDLEDSDRLSSLVEWGLNISKMGLVECNYVRELLWILKKSIYKAQNAVAGTCWVLWVGGSLPLSPSNRGYSSQSPLSLQLTSDFRVQENGFRRPKITLFENSITENTHTAGQKPYYILFL